MRTAFLCLVLANLAFFAWRYYEEHLAPRPGDPVAQQLDPERIKLIPAEAVQRMTGAAKPVACVELGPFAAADAGRAEQAVNALAAGLQVAARKTDEAVRWWVYLPPLATRAAATQRVAELKKQGVEDSLVINDDPQWRNGVSLGVFRSEEAAAKRLDELRRRGVEGAEVGQRDAGTARVYLQLRDAPEPVRSRLAEVRDAFPGTEVRECPGK